MISAPVNKIIPFSVVDGPGSRVAVFFQGCEFNCRYCHNAETIRVCINCGFCVAGCPTGALSFLGDKVVWNSALCCNCDACFKGCAYSSSPKISNMNPEELMEAIRPSLAFARGVTASGGECTQHHDFLVQWFRLVHVSNKTAFVDTNGQIPFRDMPELAAEMDMAMLDIKSFDNDEHIMLTGCSNATVLENLEYLLELKKLYEVRTVVVPGLLDSARTVKAVSDIIAGRGVRYKLIKFRTWGVRGDLQDTASPSDGEMEILADIARRGGVEDILTT